MGFSIRLQATVIVVLFALECQVSTIQMEGMNSFVDATKIMDSGGEPLIFTM